MDIEDKLQAGGYDLNAAGQPEATSTAFVTFKTQGIIYILKLVNLSPTHTANFVTNE